MAWKTLPQLYPFDFFSVIAEQQPEYFRIVRETGTGRTLAFLIAARLPVTDQNLLLLAVHPDHRNQGLRRALLRQIQDVLKEEGERAFRVELDLTDRSTIEFFRRQGFHVVGLEEATSGSGVDRLVLAKPLV